MNKMIPTLASGWNSLALMTVMRQRG